VTLFARLESRVGDTLPITGTIGVGTLITTGAALCSGPWDKSEAVEFRNTLTQKHIRLHEVGETPALISFQLRSANVQTLLANEVILIEIADGSDGVDF